MEEYTTGQAEKQEGRISVLPFFVGQLEPLLGEILEKLTWLSLQYNRTEPAIEEQLIRLEDAIGSQAEDIYELKREIESLKRELGLARKGQSPEPKKKKVPKPKGYV